MDNNVLEKWVVEFNFEYFKDPSVAAWHIHEVRDMVISNRTAFERKSILSPWLVVGIFDTYEHASDYCQGLKLSISQAEV